MIFTPGVIKVRSQAVSPSSVGRKYIGLMLTLVSGLLLLGLIGCSGDPKPSSARANVVQAVPVSVATAQRRDVPYYLTGLGSVSAFYTVSVKSRVDGQLVQVNFNEGQFVKEGEQLALDAKNAKGGAGNSHGSGSLQKIFGARSAQAGNEQRGDGHLQPRRHQSAGELPADGGAIPDLVWPE